jgi:DNA-binding response OmpR family regulator
VVNPRILIVAGDVQLRATLTRWLVEAGYSVEVAEDLRRAQEFLGDVDIALAVVASDAPGATDPGGRTRR